MDVILQVLSLLEQIEHWYLKLISFGNIVHTNMFQQTSSTDILTLFEQNRTIPNSFLVSSGYS